MYERSAKVLAHATSLIDKKAFKTKILSDEAEIFKNVARSPKELILEYYKNNNFLFKKTGGRLKN